MIKTKLIKTDKAEILVLGGLPENIKKMGIISARDETGHCQSFRWVTSEVYLPKDSIESGIRLHAEEITLPEGKWQTLGSLYEITDNQWESVLSKEKDGRYKMHIHFPLKDIPGCIPLASNIMLSGIGLVAANCKLRNKYGGTSHTHANGYPKYANQVLAWKSEQEKVFTNPFLLKRIE